MDTCTKQDLVDFFVDLSLEHNNDEFLKDIIVGSLKERKIRKSAFKLGVITHIIRSGDRAQHRLVVLDYINSKPTAHWVEHCKTHFGERYVSS